MNFMRSRKFRVCLLILCLAIVGTGAFFVMRWMIGLRDPETLARFQQFISSLGIGGWLLLMIIQYVQIIVAFVPGGPIQIVAGALFGPVGGYAVSILGILLANITVFSLVDRYGHRVIKLFVKENDLSKYSFLGDSKRLEFLTVLLFLIPGAPKDALIYLFALTPISLSRFMLLSTVARTPALLTSVLVGDSIASGEWMKALICFIMISGISLGGLALHRRIMEFYHKKQG